MEEIKLSNAKEATTYNFKYQKVIIESERGITCGDYFFNRHKSQKIDIKLKVITIPNDKNILEDTNLKYILNKLKNLYTLQDNVFTCKTRASYIFLIRIIRLQTRYAGREVLSTAILLNKTKKWNIYKCLYEANIYNEYKKQILKHTICSNIIFLPSYLHYNFGYLNNSNTSTIQLYIRKVFKLKSTYLKLLLDTKNPNNREVTNTYFISNIKGNNLLYVKKNDKLLINKEDFNKGIILMNKINNYKFVLEEDIKNINDFLNLKNKFIRLFEKYDIN